MKTDWLVKKLVQKTALYCYSTSQSGVREGGGRGELRGYGICSRCREMGEQPTKGAVVCFRMVLPFS